MKHFGKKIIVLTYLTTILLGLVVPFSASYAQTTTNPLVISASKTTIRPSETTRITATILQENLGPLDSATINFPNFQIRGGIFTPSTCIVTRSGGLIYLSCFVDFSSTTTGSFDVKAWVTTDQRYDSNTIPILVAETIVITPPPTPLNILVLSANPKIIAPGRISIITATLNATDIRAKTIRFFSLQDNDISTKRCEMPAGQAQTSCTVAFNSSLTQEDKTFYITGSVYIEGERRNYTGDGVEVRVKKTIEEIETTGCPEGQEKNEENICVLEPQTKYTLLAPLPGLSSIETDKTQGGTCPLGKYLNIMIKLILGIAAVLAMVMIVMGGIEYMTSELVSGKEAGRETITHAVLGLLIALGAWLILNTINPKLLETCLNFPAAEITIIDNFEISGAQSPTIGGQVIKVNFKRDAYPAAKIASQKTGVKISLILAIFAQESGSGLKGIRGTGQCTINNPDANMYEADKVALRGIIQELGRTENNTPVSCSFKVNGQYAGHGGAIGYAQALPTTWNIHKAEIKSNLGKTTPSDPWDVKDALMFIGVFMKYNGGIASPYNGACRYFGRCSFGGVDYAARILSIMASLEKQIADAIKKGELTP